MTTYTFLKELGIYIGFAFRAAKEGRLADANKWLSDANEIIYKQIKDLQEEKEASK